jgi:hypothetical protein
MCLRRKAIGHSSRTSLAVAVKAPELLVKSGVELAMPCQKYLSSESSAITDSDHVSWKFFRLLEWTTPKVRGANDASGSISMIVRVSSSFGGIHVTRDVANHSESDDQDPNT